MLRRFAVQGFIVTGPLFSDHEIAKALVLLGSIEGSGVGPLSITMIVRRITERRAKARPRYLLMLPYLLIIGLCVSQFVRPTLLGWFVLTVAFGSYTAGIAANLPDHKSVLALLLTALPTAFLVLEVNRSQSIK